MCCQKPEDRAIILGLKVKVPIIILVGLLGRSTTGSGYGLWTLPRDSGRSLQWAQNQNQKPFFRFLRLHLHVLGAGKIKSNESVNFCVVALPFYHHDVWHLQRQHHQLPRAVSYKTKSPGPRVGFLIVSLLGPFGVIPHHQASMTGSRRNFSLPTMEESW